MLLDFPDGILEDGEAVGMLISGVSLAVEQHPLGKLVLVVPLEGGVEEGGEAEQEDEGKDYFVSHA